MNQLIMVIFCGFILWAGNSLISLAPLINLVFNFFMLVILVIYIMQFLGVIKNILPSPRF